jgi:hypothetical protein
MIWNTRHAPRVSPVASHAARFFGIPVQWYLSNLGVKKVRKQSVGEHKYCR